MGAWCRASPHIRSDAVENLEYQGGGYVAIGHDDIERRRARQHRAAEVFRPMYHRDQEARQLERVWVEPDLIFATSFGTAIEPRNVNRAWEALRDRAGVPGIRPHDLRHAAASMAFAAGASIKEVQAMLRRSRESTTSDIYVRVLESVRKGTADRMERRLAEDRERVAVTRS